MGEEIMDVIDEHNEGGEKEEKSWLNSAIAIAVVVIAVVLAMSEVDAGKVALSITSTKQEVVDQWNFYQAKSIKQHLFDLHVNDYKLKLLSDRDKMPLAAATAYEKQINKYETEIKRYDKEKEEIKGKAEDKEKEFEILESKHGKLDFAAAIFHMALALFAITALTKKKPLFFLSLVVACAGCFIMSQAMMLK